MDDVLMVFGLSLSCQQVIAVEDCSKRFIYIDMHKYKITLARPNGRILGQSAYRQYLFVRIAVSVVSAGGLARLQTGPRAEI